MKILIIGAGRIGSAVAESLVSEANDITIIDRNADNVNYLMSRYDLRGLVGEALNPKLLKEAGAADTDMLIAVTSTDESNLAVCLLAAQIFNIPTRIARVRNAELRDYPRILKEEGFSATTLIWPEQALTNYITKLIDIPEALQVKDFDEGAASLIAVRADTGSPMIGGPISELQAHIPQANAGIVALFRNGKSIPIKSRTLIEAGDEVLILTDTQHARLAVTQFRKRNSVVRSLIIAGSSTMSSSLVEELCLNPELDKVRPESIRVIEEDQNIAEKLAIELGNRATIICGDFDDEDTLASAGVESCDLFISLSDDDENNILSAMLAKRLGAKRTIAMVNRQVYGDLIEGSKIDVSVSQTQAALDELIRYVRRGDVTAAYTLRHGIAEALEIVAHGTEKTSKVIGKKVSTIKLPENCRIGGIIRKDKNEGTSQVLMPRADLMLQPEDHVIVFIPNRRLISKIEKLFAVEVGFF